MLFAISGSQGSGKTTVIKELEKAGYPTVQRKTSRSIMDEWGVTLSEVNNDRQLTERFQDEILNRKLIDEAEAIEDISRIWFTERTYADLFTYALIAIGKDNEYSEWLDNYFGRCKDAQGEYAHNFYLRSGQFDVEKDGVRGINQHYVQLIDNTMKYVTDQMGGDLDPATFQPNLETSTVPYSDLSARVVYILESISEYTIKPKSELPE